MKRIFNLLSLAGIVVALALILALRSSEIPPIQPQSSKEGARSPFSDFPLDRTQVIEFDIDENAFTQFTTREQRDQLKDWLMLTALSSAQLPGEVLRESLYDFPTVRYGYMRSVADFEYGDTRSRHLGDGSVIALVPPRTPEQRLDDLVRIADEHRKNTGDKPKSLVLFEYELKPSAHAAVVTRRAKVNAGDLFTQQAGYRESSIRSLSDLQNFLGQIDDLTFAHLDGDSVTLGGRRIRDHQYRGIRVEDVAAIWQAEEKIHIQLAEFDQRWQAQFDALNNRWKNKSFPSSQRTYMERQYNQEAEALQSAARQEREKLKLVNGSGFSLDPACDYDGLLRFLLANESKIQLLISGERVSSVEYSLQEAMDGLRARDQVPYLKFADALKKSNSPRAVLLGEFLLHTQREKFSFQAARYDGDLKGTQVGMVLFYTDLLAKLWALDFQRSAPNAAIEDFKPMTQVAVSPIYKQEVIDLPNTRLWFGPQNKGFQTNTSDGSLLFSRNATRVYAASSNPLQPGRETEPAADSEAFLGWWNDHYEEVARYEPEYERLNEVMKWSILISWLNEAQKGGILNFLRGVPVVRSYRFPEWVQNQSQLRFQAWSKVAFLPPGHKGTKTEALPLLSSESYSLFGQAGVLSGGVSLASKGMFKERHGLSTEISAVGRRSTLDYGASKDLSRHTLEGVVYDFQTPTAQNFSVTAHAKQSAKLRGKVSELANGSSFEFQQTFSHGPQGFQIDTRAGGQALGSFHVNRTEQGLRAAWRSRDIDTGQALARRLSRSSDIERTILEDPSVTGVVTLPGEQQYLVKMQGSDRWLKLSREATPNARIKEGWMARTADPADGTHNILLSWLDDQATAAELKKGGTVVIESVEGTKKSVLRYEPTRGPPTQSKPVEVTAGNVTIKGSIDPQTGAFYVRQEDLPPAFQQDPSTLSSFLHAADREKIRIAAKEPGQTVHYAIPNTRSVYDPGFLQKVERKAYEEIAHDIANNPVQYKQHLEYYLAEEMKRSDQLVKDGHYTAAVQHVDELIDLYGPVPDLLLRKGMAHLYQGSPTKVTTTLRSAASQPLRNRTAFFDEINARLQQPGLSQTERDNVYRLAAYADWNDLHIHGFGPHGKVILGTDKDALTLQYHLGASVDGAPLSVDDARLAAQRAKDHIYIQDTSGFNNLDWHGSFEHTLEQVISGKTAKMIVLPRGDIVHFNPTVIYGADDTTAFNSIRNASNHIGHNSYHPYRDRECRRDDGTDCEDSGQSADKKVYLVVDVAA
jgi:hypothetical protein